MSENELEAALLQWQIKYFKLREDFKYQGELLKNERRALIELGDMLKHASIGWSEHTHKVSITGLRDEEANSLGSRLVYWKNEAKTED